MEIAGAIVILNLFLIVFSFIIIIIFFFLGGGEALRPSHWININIFY